MSKLQMPEPLEEKSYNDATCKECFDVGYLWDSTIPCNKCDTGKANEHISNKISLKIHERRAKELRRKIKVYST